MAHRSTCTGSRRSPALLAPRYPLQAALLALASVLTRLELRFAFDDLPG